MHHHLLQRREIREYILLSLLQLNLFLFISCFYSRCFIYSATFKTFFSLKVRLKNLDTRKSITEDLVSKKVKSEGNQQLMLVKTYEVLQ